MNSKRELLNTSLLIVRNIITYKSTTHKLKLFLVFSHPWLGRHRHRDIVLELTWSFHQYSSKAANLLSGTIDNSLSLSPALVWTSKDH